MQFPTFQEPPEDRLPTRVPFLFQLRKITQDVLSGVGETNSFSVTLWFHISDRVEPFSRSGSSHMKRILLSWSSGKDSAWCLHILRLRREYEVVGLLTTFNEAVNRVAMHAVRRELVERNTKRALPVGHTSLGRAAVRRTLVGALVLSQSPSAGSPQWNCDKSRSE